MPKTEKALDEAVEKLENVETKVETETSEEIKGTEELEPKTETSEEIKGTEELEPKTETSEEIKGTEEQDAINHLALNTNNDDFKPSTDNPVIPDPIYIEGETVLETFNHKSAIINGKNYPISRAQHKALVTGNLSVLKDIVK